MWPGCCRSVSPTTSPNRTATAGRAASCCLRLVQPSWPLPSSFFGNVTDAATIVHSRWRCHGFRYRRLKELPIFFGPNAKPHVTEEVVFARVPPQDRQNTFFLHSQFLVPNAALNGNVEHTVVVTVRHALLCQNVPNEGIPSPHGQPGPGRSQNIPLANHLVHHLADPSHST